jgi:murein DD-endopeptidase MepM/ murein hydrolase activator NlpD
LAGFSLTEVSGLVSNQYYPPKPGLDGPHQGVDFAVQQNGIAVIGNPVQVVLGGEVAAVILDRFPYGNTVVIETPLDDMPFEWLAVLPTPAPTLEPHPALTCPQTEWKPSVKEGEGRSLYLLYAHLDTMEMLRVDDALACGEMIGTIGQSGNALNPHLHLEARFGPAGARFESMAHYDSSASPEEMGAYCIWRVSGIFQLLNPLAVLSMGP